MAFKEEEVLVTSEKKKASVRRETNVVSGISHDRAKQTPKTAPHSEPPTSKNKR